MALKTHGSDVWLTIEERHAPYVLHKNEYGLFFKRFVFVRGLDSPFALVVYRAGEGEEQYLRLDVQKRAFAVAIEDEHLNHFFHTEIAPALLNYLEAHSSELTAYYLSQLLENQREDQRKQRANQRNV